MDAPEQKNPLLRFIVTKYRVVESRRKSTRKADTLVADVSSQTGGNPETDQARRPCVLGPDRQSLITLAGAGRIMQA